MAAAHGPVQKRNSRFGHVPPMTDSASEAAPSPGACAPASCPEARRIPASRRHGPCQRPRSSRPHRLGPKRSPRAAAAAEANLEASSAFHGRLEAGVRCNTNLLFRKGQGELPPYGRIGRHVGI
ncbi:hypothetical protein PVAP13_3NG182187 [Panicum virgatum]|uniref:Uncharacterized protein n=1 Tax=Panicum virgatum TaxID=38727 RepID=A0A8T0U987_PANVG|nr:hypothetical protein PVAP13_3NG182187 [Panicum virgatum]